MSNFLCENKLVDVCNLLDDGNSIRAVSRLTGVHTMTISKVSRGIDEFSLEEGYSPLACKCGKPLREHRGWCSERYKKSEKRQAFIKSWPKRKKYKKEHQRGFIRWSPGR
ncbi:hypothetical protein LCGC14_0517090 [marine sediment metagenome]|uniref:Uncharacterized protein n=1 Tax=marine sediment metagenome TaxID=412755 RepID=A0A0F9RZP5_9ZZZZ